MTADLKTQLEADVAAAEADVTRIRADNARVAEGFRTEPTDDMREVLKRGAASLAGARDRAEAARATLAIFEKTGSPHGVVALEGRVAGTIAVKLPAGTGKEQREKLIDAELATPLSDLARELGVVLAAAPVSYTRERPGRDDEGRTVLEVVGRIEGDQLHPAVSRSARTMRT